MSELSDEKGDQRDTWFLLRTGLSVGTLTIVWLAVNAVWGLTGEEDTLLSSSLRHAMPLAVWVAVAVACTLIVAVTGIARKSRPQTVFGFMLLAYIGGVAVSRFIYERIDPRGGIPIESYSDTIWGLWERSFLLWPALPMLAVYFLFAKKEFPEAIRFGNWKQAPTDLHAPEKPRWHLYFIGFFVLFVLPLIVFMQMSVNFGPIKNGSALVFLLPLATMALFNAYTEELLFRGLLQSAFSVYVGPGTAVVLQGIFFGFHHWGSSPDLIAGLPTAIFLCALGIFWGKSVVATGGIGWAVITHALVDLAFFAAHFVKS